jgi:nucleotide-binding universal stress UspA family protein
VIRGQDAISSHPPFTNILGATDLSDASATVVELASSLSHQTGATLTFVQGVASQSIVETASNNGSDLIVIGFQNRGATNHVIMNSTTAKVLRQAACPVLVVPAQRMEGALIPLESTGTAAEPAFAHR